MGYSKIKDFLRNFINALLPACGISCPTKENLSKQKEFFISETGVVEVREV